MNEELLCPLCNGQLVYYKTNRKESKVLIYYKCIDCKEGWCELK